MTTRWTTALLAVALALPAGTAGAAEPLSEIHVFLEVYERALTAKDLERLGELYHPDVTIFEGGGIDRSWADYRDHHLAPELQAIQELEFTRQNATPWLLGPDGRFAYVAAEYRLRGRLGDRALDASGLETLVLERDEQRGWRIRHAHISSRRRPAEGSAPHD